MAKNGKEQQSLLPGFRVSLPPEPGSRGARRMTAGSGARLYECYPRRGPLGRCLRTLLESSTWVSTECLMMWKPAATRQRRLIYRLAESIPPSDGIGSGLWATPRRVMPDNLKSNPMITKNGRILRRTGNDFGMNLRDQISMALWPTPKSTPSGPDYARRKREGAGGDDLATCLAETGSGGAPNPEFVGWLMGYPESYLRHWATPSSPKSHTES